MNEYRSVTLASIWWAEQEGICLLVGSRPQTLDITRDSSLSLSLFHGAVIIPYELAMCCTFMLPGEGIGGKTAGTVNVLDKIRVCLSCVQ